MGRRGTTVLWPTEHEQRCADGDLVTAGQQAIMAPHVVQTIEALASQCVSAAHRLPPYSLVSATMQPMPEPRGEARPRFRCRTLAGGRHAWDRAPEARVYCRPTSCSTATASAATIAALATR
jgi:hypothetical protein